MKKNILVFALWIAVQFIPVSVAAQAPFGGTFWQEGIASWYGHEFDGRPTASGEIFNSSLLTAAHPTLPFGTFVIVTNRHNNRQVAVRINDRGPFVASRVIDVSRAAAEQLDMLITGTAPVLVESIHVSNPQQPHQVQPMAQTPISPQPIMPMQPPAQPLPEQFQPVAQQPQPAPQPEPLPIAQQPPVQQPVQPAPQPQPEQIQQPPQQPPMQALQQVVHTPSAPQPDVQPAHPQVVVVPSPGVGAPSAEATPQGHFAPITVTVFPPTQITQPSTPNPQAQNSPGQQPDMSLHPDILPHQMMFELEPVLPPQTALGPEHILLSPDSAPLPSLEPLPVTRPGARLIPPIDPLPNRTYSLQVGSYRVARNAVDTYVKLREAGLNPEYQRYEDFFRVVLRGINGNDVQSVAETLERAGYREAIIRTE